ncbi:MAG: hypothetical protein H6906_00515 [Hyphomicrobiales bacterium]|nr:hypothetical protein [Hyphomicrobiales bacterium]
MTQRIAVAVAVGRHPGTGRARRCPLSSRALELALRLSASSERVEVMAVHAGTATSAALRDYLGMGLGRLTVIPVAEGDDIVPALAAWCQDHRPDVFLCGARTLDGAGSGEVPYRVAALLDQPVVSEVVDLTLRDHEVTVLQAHAKGRRRRLVSSLPVVLGAAPAAPAPRYPAFALSRRGRIIEAPAPARPVPFRPRYEVRPGTGSPAAAAKTDPDASAAERLAAVLSTAAGGGSVVAGCSADEVAHQLIQHLAGLGVLPAGSKAMTEKE